MNLPSHDISIRTSSGALYPVPRRWPRFHVHLPVVITTESEQSGILVPGLVGEISRGGMALYAGIRSKPGERMYIDFRTSNQICVSAVVRNCAGYSLGLEFLSIQTADSQAALLEVFLERHDRYLNTRRAETDRARQGIRKVRQMRDKMETLLQAAPPNRARSRY